MLTTMDSKLDEGLSQLKDMRRGLDILEESITGGLPQAGAPPVINHGFPLKSLDEFQDLDPTLSTDAELKKAVVSSIYSQ